jgi:predicted ATPase
MVGRLPATTGKGARDLVNIADVGFGVSQILPVVVALLKAEPGQLVYLEQPEIHLHPKAQVALAELLANAANRGVRVVAETHSALLVLAVQALMAEKELSPEAAILHWFRRDQDGVTKISTAELDQQGAYGDWPEDFGDVELSAQSRYMDAVEKQMFRVVGG